MQDYYEALGIELGASEVQIKDAYRNAQKKWHPDRNPGDDTAANRFRDAAAAYEILGDPDKKRLYDIGVGDDGTFDPSKFVAAEFNEDTLLRGFVSMFGTWLDAEHPGMRERAEGMVARQQERKEQAAKAAAAAPKPAPKARAKASKAAACSTCGGSGQIVMSQGSFAITRPCRACSPK